MRIEIVTTQRIGRIGERLLKVVLNLQARKDSKENCGIQPKLLYNLLGLDTSKLLIVEYEVQKKRRKEVLMRKKIYV